MADHSQAGARVVIAGAGHAGGALAALLRQLGFEGSIVLVGEEPTAPYQRPPLSKLWLKGEAELDAIILRPLEFYADSAIELIRDVRVEHIDRQRRVASLSSGRSLGYDHLILATGMRPNRLSVPGAELDNVLSLRTVADAEALKMALGPGRKLVIIGGGYIGLEVAASARARGSEVTILERESRLLVRSSCAALSEFFRSFHEARGVRFRLSASVSRLVGEAGAVTAVELADGERIACDAVLVGVGGAPNQELAAAAGLEVDGGVVVGQDSCTSDPAVFAIGDVSRRPVPLYGRSFRLESVPGALEQAKQAAHAILERPAPTPEVPWNWSDQYDLKLQMAGLAVDADEVLLRGDPASGRFAVFHLKGDRVRAMEAINAPPEFMVGRHLIASGAPVSRERLTDPEVSMKAVTA